MIIRDRPSGLRLFLLLRGSILPRILPALIVNILVATLVTLSHGDLFKLKITLTTIPFTLIGLPLAIFLGFRNNAAYDRFWEGRKLWGELVLRSRNFSRQCLSLIDYPEPALARAGFDDIRVRMIYRAIAFSHALRDLLRDLPMSQDIQPLLQKSEWLALSTAHNKPDFLMQKMGMDLRQCLKESRIDACLAVSIDATLSAMSGAAAACERIRNTPIPFSYTLLLHRTAYIYCFLLPFGLVDSIGFMTPFVVGIVAYTFFGLDVLGDEIEEPFGLQSNDLPLDSICRAIEIDLRASLQDEYLPKPMPVVNYCLT
ncbi:bestrophin family protein [Undibacterium sp. RTI2.1]|uniref:bestrophin family protein n=1 Tax=unclassified Undibacterium TaxID=2630295 RepID=UPI002AB57EAE|nr:MULTISPECIES: bestrophin family protein [unclassified Undibacterium]MDY7538813.1 bestrophin family protein [Undibacterium sp. 5I1]MEB0031995.1 bestrophin family protein [Undibacterium sp. RTI2.1]MEB0118204.1 bestrophin family protein [Undibacterium sp. RTI2.2]MEB0231844.1 bestrophin family protein [Undibacterium sp. 10I3]MEB0258930.1 bestrophin family protein [Undibacterium sp. 5I1]